MLIVSLENESCSKKKKQSTHTAAVFAVNATNILLYSLLLYQLEMFLYEKDEEGEEKRM